MPRHKKQSDTQAAEPRLVVQISQFGGRWRNLYDREYVLRGTIQETVGGLEAAEARHLVETLNARPKWDTRADYRVVPVGSPEHKAGFPTN